MKKLFTLLIGVLLTLASIAQVENTTYQAVFRNLDGSLMVEQEIEVEIRIVDDEVFNNTLYIETHTTETNVNGLATLLIGTGVPLFGTYEDLDWGNGVYAFEVSVDGEYLNTTLLTASPYALYAKEAGSIKGIDFSKFVLKDSLEFPLLPIPTKISELTNDEGFITIDDIPEEVVVPTKLSELENDEGFITIDDVPNTEEFVNKAYVDSLYMDLLDSIKLRMTDIEIKIIR